MRTLVEKLQKERPNRNVLFTAIEKLTKPKDIKQFYGEYIEYLRTEGGDEETRNNPEKVANSNIGYALGYYSQETARRWMDLLESVSHPVFGRNIPYDDPTAAFQADRNAVKV